MKTKQKPIYDLSLRLKIAVGYGLLVLLFGAVVWIVWSSKQQLVRLNRTEQTIQEKRKTVNRTFEQLLDLSFSDDLLLSGDTAALSAYRDKRLAAVATLGELKTYYSSAAQQSRIDSVCIFLEQNEAHLYKVLETLSAQDATEEMFYQRIPYIASQVKKESAAPVKKKGGFLGLFRKKQNPAEQPSAAKTSAMLYSLRQEVHDRQREHQELLAAYTDSLHHRNMQLNEKLNDIVRDFEAEAVKTMEREHAKIVAQRVHSFRIISLTSVLAILLSIVFYIFIHRDIAQKSSYRRRLEVSDRKKEELLSARKNMMLTISHDLRAPLAAISGYAELLPDERRKENRRRYSDAILQSSERMLGLLNTLLGFYRLETGKEQPENKPFRLQPLADILTGEYAPLAAKKQLEFSTDYDGGDIVVTGDRERTLEIIANLLSNAVKFTAQGSVRLNMHYASDELTVTVEDTGAGMTEAETEAIFQPFERLDKSEVQGFGLGLSITLALVSLLNGTLEVASSPGKGSRFTVRLPLPLCKDADDASQTPSALPCVRHLQVAVVDNDAVLLAMTVRMFDRNEIYADGFGSARELLEGMRTRRYDLILTDIVMPGMSGFGLLELLRSSNLPAAKTVPVVAMTARAERSEEEFVRAGFAGCLFKPFSRAELATAVSRCTAGQATEQTAVADFSMLLTNEQDKREMFALLVRETLKNMEALAAASEHCDTEALAALLHHLSPLWEALRIDGALLELRRALSSDNPSCDTLRSIADRIADTGKRLVEQIEAELKEGGYA